MSFPWRTWLAREEWSGTADAYRARLQRGGYSESHIQTYLHAVGHFAHWFTREHLTWSALDESVVHRFLTSHLPTCGCSGRVPRTLITVRAALGHLLDELRVADRIPPRRREASAVHAELARFVGYLDEVGGLAANTRAGRRWWIAQFLTDHFGAGPITIARLTPHDLTDFLVRTGRTHTPGTAAVRAAALRSYLRFRSVSDGDQVERLVAAIPTIASWRLAALPSALTPDETERFLQAFDQRTATGQRGYAMARCMVDLGLRVREVAALQLGDLNWREGTMRLAAGKARRADVLPLPVLTGQALVAYLQLRPPSPSRAVFVRDRAPHDAPMTTEIVRHAMDVAFFTCGLADRYSGTHILRRTAATRMRLSGASLKQIADVLRHRQLDTTTLYTKIDRPQLATVAAPWPGGVA